MKSRTFKSICDKKAKFQWLLFKLFKYKSKNPCGYIINKQPFYDFYCHQPFDLKHIVVINNDKEHKAVCPCCGKARIISSDYLQIDEEINIPF